MNPGSQLPVNDQGRVFVRHSRNPIQKTKPNYAADEGACVSTWCLAKSTIQTLPEVARDGKLGCCPMALQVNVAAYHHFRKRHIAPVTAAGASGAMAAVEAPLTPCRSGARLPPRAWRRRPRRLDRKSVV